MICSRIGIIWGHGQNWIDVRRFTKKILKEFGYGKIKIMDQSLNDSANQLVESIKIDLLDSSDGTFFVDAKKFSVHVLNVVWNLAGGYKFNPNDENLKRNMECVDKVDRVFGYSNPYNMFPFLKTWFPKQMQHAEHIKIHNEIHEFTEVKWLLKISLVFMLTMVDMYLQSLINDAKEKRGQRLDSEATSFIEAFLDKIEENRGDLDTIFTSKFSHKLRVSFNHHSLSQNPFLYFRRAIKHNCRRFILWWFGHNWNPSILVDIIFGIKSRCARKTSTRDSWQNEKSY